MTLDATLRSTRLLFQEGVKNDRRKSVNEKVLGRNDVKEEGSKSGRGYEENNA